MEINNTHNTHNLTCSSSETQYNYNEESSSSSSNKDYFKKQESVTEWSKIIKNNSSKPLGNSIINEEEMNITNKSYEEGTKDKVNKSKSNPKNKSKGKYKKTKYKKNYKKGYKNYLGQKFTMLDNGIIVKRLNKLKKEISPVIKLNQIYLSKDDKNKNLQLLNNEKIININIDSLYPKFKQVKKDSFQLMFIKRPNRSFFTKICKYKKTKYKKNKSIKKLNHSSSAQTTIGIGSKNQAYSSRITPMTTLIVPKKEKEKSKTLIRNKNQVIDNSENKLFSLSTTSVKKLSVISNASLYFNKSNNIMMNNNLKKRPLSSINIPRSEIDKNLKYSKIDNFDITTNNKSYNNTKTRPISSMMNSQMNQSDRMKIDNLENIIYENANFMNQFKELKNAFENFDDNNINNNKNYFNNNKFIKKADNYNTHYYYNTLRDNHNNEIIKTRKLNSAKLNKTSYHHFYRKEISPLYNLESQNKFEDEKQSKQNKYCNNCGYQKHFGNEKNCPICVTLKEHNRLREKKLSNKYYYFPFKNKYEINNSLHNSFKRNKNSFMNFTTEKIIDRNNFYQQYININKGNKNSFNNTIYINNLYNSPKNLRKKFFENKMKCKGIKRNKSNIYNEYDVLQKYFE